MKLKSKIFNSKFSDLKIEVVENGWITLNQNNGEDVISLGRPENLRIELLEEALKYSRRIMNKKKKAELKSEVGK
jgi:hypothetical protein